MSRFTLAPMTATRTPGLPVIEDGTLVSSNPATGAEVGRFPVASPDDVRAAVERALTFKPQDLEALNTRGIVLTDLGRLNEALMAYSQALALAPDFPDTLNNRALVLKMLKLPEEALAPLLQQLFGRPLGERRISAGRIQ